MWTNGNPSQPLSLCRAKSYQLWTPSLHHHSVNQLSRTRVCSAPQFPNQSQLQKKKESKESDSLSVQPYYPFHTVHTGYVFASPLHDLLQTPEPVNVTGRLATFFVSGKSSSSLLLPITFSYPTSFKKVCRWHGFATSNSPFIGPSPVFQTGYLR